MVSAALALAKGKVFSSSRYKAPVYKAPTQNRKVKIRERSTEAESGLHTRASTSLGSGLIIRISTDA